MRFRLLALTPLFMVGALGLPDATAAGPPQGIDVSKYQHDNGQPINWAAVKRSGQSFAFIKATGGSNRIDPWFEREWAAAGKAGMIRGAYHYADPSSDADAQAALVVSVVGTTREAGNLGIALDLESTGGLEAPQLAAWAHRFLDGVERRTGRTPILYTYVSFWSGPMAGNRTFGAYPLWLARYGPRPAPLAGWSQWTFWQYSDSGRVAGIPGFVDRNEMCCSTGTLAALADGRSREIAGLWRKLGGASGQLGLPLGPEVRIAGGWGQTFQKGYVGSTRSHGTHAVLGAHWDRYQAAGAAGGALGVPASARQTVAAGVTQQVFAKGRIVHSAATGAHALRGGIEARWLKAGGRKSAIGLPRAEQIGSAQQFVAGGLYGTVQGVRFVPGAIRDRYEELGGVASPLGRPTSDAVQAADNVRIVTFQRGQLLELVVAGQRVVI